MKIKFKQLNVEIEENELKGFKEKCNKLGLAYRFVIIQLISRWRKGYLKGVLPNEREYHQAKKDKLS